MGPSGRFTHVMLYWTIWDMFIQVLYLGRAPRTMETLPDLREKCRVTRLSRVFRGLTASQRTPGFWGVTQGAGIGYYPFSSLGHDTLQLYRDTAGMAAQEGLAIRPRRACDRPDEATTRPACAPNVPQRAGRATARARMAWPGVGCDSTIVSWLRGGDIGS